MMGAFTLFRDHCQSVCGFLHVPTQMMVHLLRSRSLPKWMILWKEHCSKDPEAPRLPWILLLQVIRLQAALDPRRVKPCLWCCTPIRHTLVKSKKLLDFPFKSTDCRTIIMQICCRVPIKKVFLHSPNMQKPWKPLPPCFIAELWKKQHNENECIYYTASPKHK